MRLLQRVAHDPARARKFRQAAIVYLHYGVLYFFGARVLLERGLFPTTRGPEWVWFAAGLAILAVVLWGLWWWQNVWFARSIWLLVALRLPVLMDGAFFGGGIGTIPRSLYLAAGIVVVIVMGALARAAWDV